MSRLRALDVKPAISPNTGSERAIRTVRAAGLKVTGGKISF